MSELKPPLEIIVIREDIKAGVLGSDDACPIALALRRQLALVSDFEPSISVSGLDIRLGKELYNLPEEAREFMDTFDNNCEPEPFVFTALFWLEIK